MDSSDSQSETKSDTSSVMGDTTESSSLSGVKRRRGEEDTEGDDGVRVAKMAAAVKVLLECMGEDPTREGLQKTPERAAKALLFFTNGYAMDPREVVNGAVFTLEHPSSRGEGGGAQGGGRGEGEGALPPPPPPPPRQCEAGAGKAKKEKQAQGPVPPPQLNGPLNSSLNGSRHGLGGIDDEPLVPSMPPAEGMVVVRDIEISSLCEHHLVPFVGRAHVGYLPEGKVLGLSKLARIANVFARRLQVQERLTHEISAAVQAAVTPRGVGVVVECRHMCMCMRGVCQPGSVTTTTSLRGAFASDRDLRREFLDIAKSASGAAQR